MTPHRRIAVVGATGVLGRPVVQRLLARGHAVRAIVRRPEATAGLAPAPLLEVVPGDILEPDSLVVGLRGCDAVLHLATAIPRPGAAPGDWSRNDRIRIDGTRHLLAAATRTGCRRYVQQSVAMLHAGAPEPIATEDAPLQGQGVLASALEMERLVQQACDLQWVILRGGLFYGPGTDFSAETNRRAREGLLQLPAQGQHYVSLVHVDDMANAVVLAAESDVSQMALNIVDDRPVRWRELLGHVAAWHGAAAPQPGGAAGLPGFRVGNGRAREVLGWTPRFADYRSGWRAA